MTKKEMIQLLVDEYDYKKEDLRDEKGNQLRNDVLEKMIEEEKEKEKEGVGTAEETEEEVESATDEEEEDDIFSLSEEAFQPAHVFDDNDLILCMSGTRGGWRFVSNLSNFTVRTTQFGQTVKIPYKDIMYVYNIAPQAFHGGKIIVLNKHLQEELGLGDVYKKVITPKNIRKVLSMDSDDLSNFIADMPSGMKPALYDEARKMYREEELDSVRSIEAIEEEFGVSLEDNAPVSEQVGS